MASRQESAEVLALQALGWLAAREDLLPVFLGATGASMDDLAQGVRDVSFLAAVLDFLLMDDAWIIAFCDDAGIAYGRPLEARAWLPGGQAMHWT